jgi:NADH-quinone oxidoreductase subunit L
MLGPLLILALLSICGGWIGIERSGGWINMDRFSGFMAPALGTKAAEGGSAGLEFRMSVAAVVVAFLGWYIAHVFYQWRPSRRAEFAASLSGPYTVLANKYYVDEFYGATVVKPLMAISTYFLGCLEALPCLPGRSCNAGNRAICAPMRPGWPRARRLCCSLLWFPGLLSWPTSEFISIWRGAEIH